MGPLLERARGTVPRARPERKPVVLGFVHPKFDPPHVEP
jgi:hypothetical protein